MLVAQTEMKAVNTGVLISL